MTSNSDIINYVVALFTTLNASISNIYNKGLAYLVDSNNHATVLFIVLPLLFGLILSTTSIYRKFKSDWRRALLCGSGGIYLILSGLGAIFFTQSMKAIGVQMVSNIYINSIFMSLTGAGLFLGILSKIAVDEKIDDKLTQVKTLSDYIYTEIDDSMNRKVDREKRQVICDLLKNYDVKELINPKRNSDGSLPDGRGVIVQLIDVNSYMSDEKKQKLKDSISSFIDNPAFIFFELTKTDTNITIEELKEFVENSNIARKTQMRR